MRFLIYVIAFSITIQNTCPYGLAGKTTFMSPHVSGCPNCPFSENQQPAGPDTRKDVKKDLSNTNHLFVIHINNPDTAFQILSPASHAPYIKPDQFKDVHLDPLLRPPVSSLVSIHNS